MRTFFWLVRAFIFFTLFAFALNNQQSATIHWFFGVQWQAPMVMVVLVAFAAGAAVGVLAMLPGWWRQRRFALKRSEQAAAIAAAPGSTRALEPSGVEHPPRDGL